MNKKKQTKMKNVNEQKIKLEQKKSRLAAEEIRLKLKERKMRTRHLIEVGGLAVKAGIDFLPTNTLYGAFISLTQSLDKDHKIRDQWTKLGKDKLDQEQQQNIPIIIKFDDQPEKHIRDAIRTHGLRFNKFRAEWYGRVTNLDQLKQDLAQVKYDIEIIDQN